MIEGGQPQRVLVTVGVVLVAVRANRLYLLLIRHGETPRRKQWALPAGSPQPGETLDTAAARVLREQTAIAADDLRQFRAYSDSERDRAREKRGAPAVTVAYFGAIPGVMEPKAGAAAAEARWWPLEDALGLDLAFDDGLIADNVNTWLRGEIGNGPAATAFLPTAFTLSELRAIYEAVWGVHIDPSNFHRQLVSEPGRWLNEERRQLPIEGGRGRPAMRYSKSPRWRAGTPVANPLVRLGDLLSERRILWLDPHPQNNGLAYSFFRDAANEVGQSAPVMHNSGTADDALTELAVHPYDLVLTHWGAGAGRDASGEPVPTAIQLLRGVRAAGSHIPVIVFASVDEATTRRRDALSAGAADYCFEFDALFRRIEAVLTPPR